MGNCVATQQSVVILGVGPGLGAAAARRFAAAGYAVAIAARTAEKLDPIVAAIGKAGGKAIALTADATNEAEVTELVARTERELGPLGVAIYNASGRVVKSVLELTGAEVEEAWRRSCLGGFFLGREAAKRMVTRESGTILFTGATSAMRGSANFAAFAIGKFGLRALSQSMARELGPKGIHVAHVNIDGPINTGAQAARLAAERAPDGLLEPEAIAESYYQLHMQHRSAWTQELDVRPWVEKF